MRIAVSPLNASATNQLASSLNETSRITGDPDQTAFGLGELTGGFKLS